MPRRKDESSSKKKEISRHMKIEKSASPCIENYEIKHSMASIVFLVHIYKIFNKMSVRYKRNSERKQNSISQVKRRCEYNVSLDLGNSFF